MTQLVADSASGWTNSSLAIDSDEGTSASDWLAKREAIRARYPYPE